MSSRPCLALLRVSMHTCFRLIQRAFCRFGIDLSIAKAVARKVKVKAYQLAYRSAQGDRLKSRLREIG